MTVSNAYEYAFDVNLRAAKISRQSKQEILIVYENHAFLLRFANNTIGEQWYQLISSCEAKTSFFNIFASRTEERVINVSKDERLAKLATKEWSVEDVYHYLSYIRYQAGRLQDVAGSVLLDEEVNGDVLLQLNLEKIQQLSLPQEVGAALLRAVSKLESGKQFLEEEKIIKKLEQVDKMFFKKVQDPYDVIEVLGNEDEMRRRISLDCELVHVYLVITEAHQSERFPVSDLVSMSISGLPKLHDTSMLRTGLYIGEWYLEWNEHELVMPKRLTKASKHMLADIEPIATIKEVVPLFNKLANALVDWNLNRSFKLAGGIGETCNCQGLYSCESLHLLDFVFEVLNRMDVDVFLVCAETSLTKFLHHIRAEGQSIMQYSPNEELLKRAKLPSTSYQMSDHVALDQFVLQLLDTLQVSQLRPSFAHDDMLLRSFDRAFWLRCGQESTMVNVPLIKQGQLKCHFGDPFSEQ